MAQNTKETELKLIKITLTIGGVKSDYALDKKTNIVYDYNSYLAAKDMGGEPLMVGKIMEKDGSKSFVKMSASTLEPSMASAAVASSAKPKKPEGSVAVAVAAASSTGVKESSEGKKKVSGAVGAVGAAASSAAPAKSKDD
jgi:hypothetical protein